MIISKVMEHLRNNRPEFQLPPPPPAIPPAPPVEPSILHGQLGGVLVPPHDKNTINDHFPLPQNPLPIHHEGPLHLSDHLKSHHKVIENSLHDHKANLGYDPHVELHVKASPQPHQENIHHHHDSHNALPPKHPEPIITKTEIEAPPGCKVSEWNNISIILAFGQ